MATTSTIAANDKDSNSEATPNNAATRTIIKQKVGMREFNEEEIAIINQRNIELIHTLRNLDSAFSMGESGMKC